MHDEKKKKTNEIASLHQSERLNEEMRVPTRMFSDTPTRRSPITQLTHMQSVNQMTRSGDKKQWEAQDRMKKEKKKQDTKPLVDKKLWRHIKISS